MMIDADDMLDDARWIVEHAGDPDWDRRWELQRQIGRVVGRTTSVSRMERVLYFAKEMAR